MKDNATYLIVCRTISECSRLKRLCSNIYLAMQHAPSAISRGGCSFALKVPGVDLPAVYQHAEQFQDNLIIYREELVGSTILYTLLKKEGGCDDLF